MGKLIKDLLEATQLPVTGFTRPGQTAVEAEDLHIAIQHNPDGLLLSVHEINKERREEGALLHAVIRLRFEEVAELEIKVETYGPMVDTLVRHVGEYKGD